MKAAKSQIDHVEGKGDLKMTSLGNDFKAQLQALDHEFDKIFDIVDSNIRELNLAVKSTAAMMAYRDSGKRPMMAYSNSRK